MGIQFETRFSGNNDVFWGRFVKNSCRSHFDFDKTNEYITVKMAMLAHLLNQQFFR